MTRIRTVLLTALLVVGAMTAGVSIGASTNQVENGEITDAAIGSGEVFWQGQFLQFSAGETNASEVWSVRRVENGEIGGLVTEVLTDGTGGAVFATTGLEGQFVVMNAENEPVLFRNGSAQRVGNASDARFEIANQTLDASFEDATVASAGSSDARTGLRLESSRADYGFYLFSDGLSASELADVFSSVEVRDGRAVATRNANSDDVFDANFTGVESGTYNITVFAADGTAQDTATVTVSEPVEGTAALENATVVEQRGDVARFNVTFDGTDEASVKIGSQDVGYVARFTVTDGDGDGVATVAVNTFRAGLSSEASGITVGDGDALTDYELRTDPIPGRLDAATYPIEVSVGENRSAVGSITLEERSTEGVQVWTAPDHESIESVSQLTDVAAQTDDVAYRDWAIVQVQVSGIYGYFDDVSDLNNTTGLSLSLTRAGEMNVPSTEVSLDQGRLLVDETNDHLFFVVDSNALEAGATYQANFSVSAANPYVSSENASSYVTNFTVVERNASFDEPVEVSPTSDATISGTSTVAPGTELTLEAANTDESPFLERQTATVSEDGTWEATFDFSDVPEGTNFTVSIDEPQVNASGVVASDGAAAAETTTAEETTAGASDEADGETTGEENEETTTEAESAVGETTDETTETTTETETETETETTTTTETPTTTEEEQGATAPAPGFGPISLLLAVLILLAVGVLATRRR